MKITQEIMNLIEAEPMYGEGTHTGFNKATSEDEVRWNDCYVNCSDTGEKVYFDAIWFGDNSPGSEDEGRWEYSVDLGDDF